MRLKYCLLSGGLGFAIGLASGMNVGLIAWIFMIFYLLVLFFAVADDQLDFEREEDV